MKQNKLKPTFQDTRSEAVKPKAKTPKHVKLLFALSVFFLTVTVIFQRMVFMAPTNPDKGFLFAYQMVATTSSWVFVITGAGALYSLLRHIQK